MGDEVRGVVGEDDAVFHGGVLEEAHFSSDVVDGGDEEVEGAVDGVELRVGHDGETQLADESADELDVGTCVVAVLVHPLRESSLGECAAACMREEGLIRRGGEDLLVSGQEVICEGRHLGWWSAHRRRDG